MTAKQKAEELYFNMSKAIASEINEDGFFSNTIHAKQCALIAVDEILKAIPNEYLDVYKGETNMIINEDVEYWQEVKQEIELL